MSPQNTDANEYLEGHLDGGVFVVRVRRGDRIPESDTDTIKSKHTECGGGGDTASHLISSPRGRFTMRLSKRRSCSGPSGGET